MKKILRRMLVLSVLLQLFALGYVELCTAEVLRTLERLDLRRQFDIGRVLCVGDDTLLLLSDSGLYLFDKSTNSCQKLVDRFPLEEQVPFSYCDNERLTRLVTPMGMWQHAAEEGNEILIYEGFCNSLCRLVASEDGRSFLTRDFKKKDDDLFTGVCVQNGALLSGLWLEPGKETVSIQRLTGGDYRRVYRYPQGLARWRDSIGVGNGYMRFCDPALNPHDSTVWLAIQGYNFIHVIDLNGNLLDSVAIPFPDFRKPPRLRSRIKSDAVVNEWDSQWTYTTSFSYVSPGYFIMQYETGKEICAGKEIVRFTTAMWDVNKRLVPLSVDPLWHVAGVQDDGRIIFVAPEADSSGCKETIIVTRIEP